MLSFRFEEKMLFQIVIIRFSNYVQHFLFFTCKKQFQVITEIMEICFALGLERIQDVKTEYSAHCRENYPTYCALFQNAVQQSGIF